AAEHPGDEALFLGVGAPVEDGRADVGDRRAVEDLGRAAAVHLAVVDELLDEPGATTAPLLRPGDRDQPRLVEAELPVAQEGDPLCLVGPGPIAGAAPFWRKVLVQEGADLVPERLILWA